MMRKSTCCAENGIKKGPWTPEEDEKLVDFIRKNGHGSWRALPKLAGLNRCGKSCRLRWTNYLRPDIKRGKFSDEEEQIIIHLHGVLGNKWATMTAHLPGRTDNEIKNFWNTQLKKKLLQMGIDPITHRPRTDLGILSNLPQLLASSNFANLLINNPWDANTQRLQSDAAQLAKIQLLHKVMQVLSTTNQGQNLDSLNSFPMNNGNVPFTFASQISNFEANQGVPNEYYHQQISNSNPIPQLVSTSPECSTANQMENKINPNDISNPSSISTSFDAFGEFMHDETSDSCWRDFIDQACGQPWPIS